MADEYVRVGQFGEFVKRIDERFDHVNELADQRFDSMNQRFLDLEKRMEQGFVHVDRRFEQVDRRLDGLQSEIRSLRTLMVALYTPIILGILGAVVKYLFFSN